MSKTESKIVRSEDFMKLICDKHKITSTYGLAKLLDEPIRSVDRYQKGFVIKKASLMVRVSELLDVDLSYVIYNILAEEAEKDGEPDVAKSFVQTAQQYAPIGIAITACFCLLFLPYISFV